MFPAVERCQATAEFFVELAQLRGSRLFVFFQKQNLPDTFLAEL